MRTNLRRGLTVALKNRDKVAITALRSALSAIDNAEALPVGQSDVANEPAKEATIGVGTTEAERIHLSDADIQAIVAHEVSERTASAEKYDQLGRDDAAGRLRAEADVLNGYLATDHHD